MTDTKSSPEAADVQAVEALHNKHQLILEQMRGVIVGQDEVIEQLMVALLCRGHCILEGVPGLAKTLIVSTLASLLNQTFRRIQFTLDLMPSDITGTDILEEDRTTGKRVFRFIPGPLFGNMILADEINRTPPKTQSALLEATQEHQLTVAGQTYPLPNPFMVLATQNPIEQEGTYPLPEAQLDRFMLKIQVDYPTREQEVAIAKRASTAYSFTISKVLTVEEILAMQELVRKMPVGDHVYEFAVDLVRRSRPVRGKSSGLCRARWWRGARARARSFFCCWPPRPGRFCKAVSTPPPATSPPWPCPCCATGSSPRSTPRPPARIPIKSSNGWWMKTIAQHRDGAAPPEPTAPAVPPPPIPVPPPIPRTARNLALNNARGP